MQLCWHCQQQYYHLPEKREKRRSLMLRVPGNPFLDLGKQHD
jgi:hypothetical protein